MKRKIKLNKSNVIIFMFLIFILIGCGKTTEENVAEKNVAEKTLDSTLEKKDEEKASYIEFNEKVFLKGTKETPDSYSVNYYPSGRVKNIMYNSSLYEVEDKSLVSLIKGLQNDINALVDKDLEYATQTYEVIPAYIIAEKLNKNIDEKDKDTLKDLEKYSEQTINKLYEKLKEEDSKIIEKVQEKILNQTKILEKLNSESTLVKNGLTLKDDVINTNNTNNTNDTNNSTGNTGNTNDNNIINNSNTTNTTNNSDNNNIVSGDGNTAKDSLQTSSNNLSTDSKSDSGLDSKPSPKSSSKLDSKPSSTSQKKIKEKTQVKKVKCNIYYDGVERDQMVLKNGQKVFVNSDGCIN